MAAPRVTTEPCSEENRSRMLVKLDGKPATRSWILNKMGSGLYANQLDRILNEEEPIVREIELWGAGEVRKRRVKVIVPMDYTIETLSAKLSEVEGIRK